MESELQCSDDSINIINDNVINDNEPKEINTYSDYCKILNMTSIPTFGQYSEDYTFLEQVLILKSNSQPDNIPQNLKTKIDNLKDEVNINPDYFHITLSTSSLLSPKSEKEVNSSYTLLNLISHPYIFYNCDLNKDKEHRTVVYCALFTDEEEIDTIQEHKDKDILRINPECKLNDNQLKREIILHLSEDGFPSLSPNNCGILINLNAQIINFYVVVCGTYGEKIVKIFVGNFVIIPNANNSVLIGDLYNKMVKEKNKEELGTELILFRNKFIDYMNYVFNFGLNEIVNNAQNLEDIKQCITKAFSIIFNFSINDEDDDNSKKIHEKELINMQNYYYHNVCNFICNLYKDSKTVDKNFGEKFLELSLKEKYIQELLLKYAQYNISRINHIILNYEFFIFENDNNILDDLQEKANEKYTEDILPNFKSLLEDILNTDEENLDKIKDDFSEENIVHIGNPYIEKLINICNSIRNEEEFNINELDEIIKKYLFYIVWDFKGRPMGVHDDFGRVSFMNNQIDKNYFCNPDDKIQCCKRLIQNFENADDKHY
jgi:hypothetical protein